MALPPPKIDARTYADLVAETERLAQHFSHWQPAADGKADAGQALIRIFGRMATMVTDRLNRLPEKHFLAFLNLIGAQQQPPRPARVPVTAYLVENSPVGALLPAHTTIAAIAPEDQTDEVLFETEQELVVMRSQLQSVIVYQNNQFCDQVTIASDATEDFPVFEIAQPTTLYLTAAQLTTQETSNTIEIAGFDDDLNRLAQTWNWSYWDGKDWQSLTATVEAQRLKLTVPESASEDWVPPQVKMIETVEAQWLRAIAPDPLPQNLPNLSFWRAATASIAPDQTFFNSEEIEPGQDFLPFGETPQVGDKFYIASGAVLSQAQAEITVSLSASNPYPFTQTLGEQKYTAPRPQGVKIRWETWTHQGWKQLKKANGTSLETDDFKGPITFQLPADLAPTEVNGENTYWLRARLAAGHYGTAPQFKTVVMSRGETSTTTVEQDADTGYFPPSLKSVTLSCSALGEQPIKVLTSLPSGAFVDSNSDISAPAETGLYLRFDRPFPHQPIALYLQIAPPQPGALRNANAVETPATVQWEYGTAAGWQPLTVKDGTQTLRQRGLVEFVGPADVAPQTWFGQSGYWLRLHHGAGEFAIAPRLQRILTNTVWATQTTTYTDEILGNGTGDPSLVVKAQHRPVLPGQRLVVREPELPPENEQAEIKKLSGDNGLEVVTNSAGEPTEIWVCWHQVSDFYGSGSRDRHYTLDRMTGEIRFGGAGQGLAPPRGRNNIRLAHYQSGGGQQGNCAAETLTELKTTVPYVDRVTNHEPAGGGADVEPIASVQQSGPKQLRHRDRAVTWQDIEDLTYAASSDIARVQVLTPSFNPVLLPWLAPGEGASRPTELEDALNKASTITILIVPHGTRPQPTPSLGLIEQVKQYLQDRISPDLNLHITEPPWIEVTVTATVVANSLTAVNGLQESVRQALTRFLHPLTGGSRHQGWPFGRHPHDSDLYAVIERIPGVSHVTKLDPIPPPDSSIQDRFLIFSGQHNITIHPPKQNHR